MFSKFLEIVAFGGAVIGSSLIANNNDLSKFGFVFFLVGGIASAYLLIKSNSPKALLYIQIYFGFVNAWGIYKWMF
jgi:hypothetical protein